MTRVGKVATLNLSGVAFLLGLSGVTSHLNPDWDASAFGGAISIAGAGLFQLLVFPVGWVAAWVMPPFGSDELLAPLAFFSIILVSNAYLWGWMWSKLMRNKKAPNKPFQDSVVPPHPER